MSQYEDKIQYYRQQAATTERTKIQMETKRDAAIAQKQQVEKRAADIKIDPEKIDDELTKIDGEIEALIASIDAKLQQKKV